MQTEAFRFGNKIVDDWEGRVNSWPLDEGLIDYVSARLRQRIGRERRSTPPTSSPTVDQDQRREGRRLEDHQGAAVATSCRRRAASRPTSRPAITPSSSCSGARTSTAPDRAPATGLPPTTTSRTARAATATAARSISRVATDLLVDDLAWMVGQWSQGRRRAQGAHGDGGNGGPRRDLHRARQPVLRRAGRRAHEARPADPRPRGGARLLLRQHAQLALLRRARHPERLPRQLQAHRRHAWSRGPAPPTSCKAKSPETDRNVRERSSTRRWSA